MLRVLRELRRSTAAMPDGVVMLNPQSEILWFNRNAGRLLTLRRKGDIGLRIDHALLSPTLAERLVAAAPDREERAQPQPSDHVPVVFELH